MLDRRSNGALSLPCVLMRGGTSRGPFFLESDLPADAGERDRILIAALGSPDLLQLNGLGGGHPLTSKTAIVGRSSRPDADVDYLFGQVAVERPFVDFSPNCGNMLSAVGPFAIEAGLVAAKADETVVRIFNRNTKTTIEAIVQTPGGFVRYDGSTAIDGVSGTAAPIKLTFLDAAGSKTGALLPTKNPRDYIGGIDVTLIDYAMPMVLARAEDLGLRGDEEPGVLEADQALLSRISVIRRDAGRRMGLGDVSGSVVPKFGIVSQPRRGGSITSRYFANEQRCHRSHAVTGALCIAVASKTPGSVVHDCTVSSGTGVTKVEHPIGQIEIDLVIDASGSVQRASLLRTARRIFEGNVIVPRAA